MVGTTPKLPRRAAVVGVSIAFGLLASSLLMDKYDIPHVPSLQERIAMGSYSQPRVLDFMGDAAIVLCPPLVLEIPLSDSPSYTWHLAVWCLAAALNGVLYYWLGRGIVALVKRWRKVG